MSLAEPCLRLPRAGGPRLHVARDPAAERRCVARGALQDRSRISRRQPQLSCLVEGPYAGRRLADVSGGSPVAVALGGGVRIAVRAAGAETLEDGRGHHRDLVVDGRPQRVERGGEPGQRLRESILLAGHRKRVVHDEEDVGLRRDLHLVVLRHRDQRRGLNGHRDVTLAGR